MLIVAGLSLKNLKPRVWDPISPDFLPDLGGIMVSYADFQRMPARRRAAEKQGLRAWLDVPAHIRIFLDNGAFHFLQRPVDFDSDAYATFSAAAQPDWYPIPRDVIPLPVMTDAEQHKAFEQTMATNRAWAHNGFVPVMHVGPQLEAYLVAFDTHCVLRCKQRIGLGGLVPNLLRAPKSKPYGHTLEQLFRLRAALPGRKLHLFGVGGTATLHLAALLDIDSVDSSGWRNRAARGIVQLSGRGDRMVADLGSWRGRLPSDEEWQLLADCSCPACTISGLDGLRATRMAGFSHRAIHNLWTLLEEMRQIDAHLADGTYEDWYPKHVVNPNFRPIIDLAVQLRKANSVTAL